MRTKLFSKTVFFYENVLGLQASQGSSSQGRDQNVWMSTQDGTVLVHINGSSHPTASAPNQHALDHFALRCSGLDEMRHHLQAQGVEFQQKKLEGRPVTQLILYDPNGIKVELTFYGESGA